MLWSSFFTALEKTTMSQTKLYLVVATRETQNNFFTNTETGKSYTRFRQKYQKPNSPIQLHLILFAQNKRGLSSVYNQAITQIITHDAIVVFLHDDVELCDWWWAERVLEGLQHFDIIGLAGCLKRIPYQPAWHCQIQNGQYCWLPEDNLSLHIAHRHVNNHAAYNIAHMGTTRVAVQLLDGVFLACRTETLRQTGLRFDEQFQFHFYDLDFCRNAEKLGLTMGTWDISVIHDSSGGFNETWRAMITQYFQKWET